MRHAQCARLAGSALALALLAGCSGEPPVSGNRIPTAITVIRGNNQNGEVGSSLTEPIVVRVTDARGGIPDLTVTFAVPAGQGGLLSPSSAVTDANGEAQTSWLLGGQLGTQSFTATVAGLAPASVQATVVAGAPASILPVTVTTQFVVAGRLVTVQPIVRVTDGFGNPKAGQTVTFSLGASGGTLSGPSTKVTDAEGRATVEGWSIGPAADVYSLRAEVASGASLNFFVFGVPAQIQPVGGTVQTANVGTQVAQPPSVRAVGDNGQPLANVPVNFEVTQGGGSVLGSTRTTGADGIATAGGWILGVAPGSNRVEARVTGVTTPAVFTATGVQANPASIVAASITNQTGFFGNFSAASPSVTVTDASGNPVAGTTVSFAVTQGGGSIIGGGQTTDFMGRASASAWRFGTGAAQVVRGTVAGLPPVDFTASTSNVPASEFHIEIRYPGSQPTPAQQAAFDAAVARWQSVVVGDLYDIVNFSVPAGLCPAAVDEAIDDVVIYAELVPIDGPGGVLGGAAPCYVRDPDEVDVFTTITGLMRFDTADLAMLEATGRLNDVILHEMGHVLGIGSLWRTHGLLVGFGTSNPFFTGPSAGGAFLAAVSAGGVFAGSPVPVENQGLMGTRDVHWRESILTNELMTGFLNSGNNPLSAFSIASLRDMGYVVNDAVADAFTFMPQILGGFGGEFRLVEEQLQGPIIVVDRRGRETGRIPRM